MCWWTSLDCTLSSADQNPYPSCQAGLESSNGSSAGSRLHTPHSVSLVGGMRLRQSDLDVDLDS